MTIPPVSIAPEGVRSIPGHAGEGLAAPAARSDEAAGDAFRLRLDRGACDAGVGLYPCGPAAPAEAKAVGDVAPAVAPLELHTDGMPVRAATERDPLAPPEFEAHGVGTCATSDPFQHYGDLAGRFQGYMQRQEQGEAYIRSRGLTEGDPFVASFRAQQRSELLGLQLEMGNVQFQLELVSKVIEHGTGGTRQVLQTQA